MGKMRAQYLKENLLHMRRLAPIATATLILALVSFSACGEPGLLQSEQVLSGGSGETGGQSTTTSSTGGSASTTTTTGGSATSSTGGTTASTGGSTTGGTTASTGGSTTGSTTGGNACTPDTFANYAKGFFTGYCASCHGSEWTTYNGAKSAAAMIEPKIVGKTMPPGGGLPAGDYNRITTWFKCKMPE